MKRKPPLTGRGFHVRGLYSKHSTIRNVCTVNYILVARTRIPRSDETPAIPRAAGIDARERSMSEHVTTAATVADSACRQDGSASRSGVPPSGQRAAVRQGGSTVADGGDGAAGHDPRLRAAASVNLRAPGCALPHRFICDQLFSLQSILNVEHLWRRRCIQTSCSANMRGNTAFPSSPAQSPR